MGEVFFKELKKYGLIGLILAYFLYQDAESRKVDREKIQSYTHTIRQIGETLKEESEKINNLTLDTKLNAKDIQILDERVDDIEGG